MIPALTRRQLYGIVALLAILVYIRALLNGFALDDVSIIQTNPWVHRWPELWQAFGQPYWPPWNGAAMYRPLPIVSYAIDWHTKSLVWMHLVNLLWHAGVSVATTALLLRLTKSDRAALVGGVLFAVHPLHVEAVANVVGRAELMAALFTVLAVYAALEYDQLWWSLGALTLGLLCKETAATVPALVVWGWMLGIGRSERRRMIAYATGWGVVAVAYLAVRWTILHPYARLEHLAAVFIGASPFSVRLTTIAALTDIARLLVFPAVLRVDYSPNERTLVTSLLDGRFLAGVMCFVLWAGLVWLAWRRGRRVEAFGLGWIAIAFLPVANLFFPTGVLVAERTLYLPSVGLALAAGEWLPRLPQHWYWTVLAGVTLLGGYKTNDRVPVWYNSRSVALSVLKDSPNSFSGPAKMIGIYLAVHRPADALAAFRTADSIFNKVPPVYLQGADAAFAVGQPRLADSLLDRMEQLCYRCLYYYQYEAGTALARGDTAVAESLLVRWRRLGGTVGKGDR